MTMTEHVTDWNGQGPPPIYDSEHLRRRITALDPDKLASLHEAWVSQGLPPLEPLMTAEAYAAVERLVSNREPSATGPEAWQRLNAVGEALYGLPEHIYRNACEALKTYAGIDNPRTLTITSEPRIAEAERIIGEAVAYAAEVAATVPSVNDLPPADDTAEQVAAEDYPGSKAGVPVVKAWVEHPDDETAQLNRAARAYAQEQDRSTPRKGLTKWLEERLGADGLAKVQAALAANATPPLDLGPRPSGVDEGTAGADAEHGPASTQEGGPAEPPPGDAPAVPASSVLARIATLHHQLSEAYLELAEVG